MSLLGFHARLAVAKKKILLPLCCNNKTTHRIQSGRDPPLDSSYLAVNLTNNTASRKMYNNQGWGKLEFKVRETEGSNDVGI